MFTHSRTASIVIFWCASLLQQSTSAPAQKNHGLCQNIGATSNEMSVAGEKLAAWRSNDDDDKDGCCIQWTPGQSKSCSTTKKKQCKEDAEAAGVKWDWHAGKCKETDCP